MITPEYQRRMFAATYNWAEAQRREIGVAHKHRNIHEHTGDLEWSQGEEGLRVRLPAQRPAEHALALEVRGEGLKPAPLPKQDTAIRPDPDGSIRLEPGAAALHGSKLRIERRHDHDYLGAWNSADEWASWALGVPAKATYEVSVVCSTPIRDTDFIVEIAGHRLRGTAKKTAGWYEYRTVTVGRVELSPGAGIQLAIRAADPSAWKAINVRGIRLDDVN